MILEKPIMKVNVFRNASPCNNERNRVSCHSTSNEVCSSPCLLICRWHILVYSKAVDSVEGALWLSTQTPNINISYHKMFGEMRAPWLVGTSSLYFHKARASRHTSALLRYNARSLHHRYERAQSTIRYIKEIKKNRSASIVELDKHLRIFKNTREVGEVLTFGSCLSALLKCS